MVRFASLRRSALVPFVASCLIGVVWLNQGLSAARVDAIVSANEADPAAHPLGVVRYVLLNLYERSGDEAIYFAVANALRGLPYDHVRLTSRGQDTPASFDRAPAEDGHWHRPYTEVPLEYPVAMVPLILLPSFVAGESFEAYTRAFGALMAVLLLAAAALAIRVQPAENARRQWWWMTALLLAQGGLAIRRLDALPALLLAITLLAAAERRAATAGVALGLATATKLLPAILAAPLVAADPALWRSPRARLRGLVGFAVAVGFGVGPMLFPPGALLGFLRYHSARGLHVESTWAVLLGAWRLATTGPSLSTMSYGSFNLDGPAAALFASLCTPITIVLVGLVTVRCARAGAPDGEVARRDRLAIALLAALAALWLSAKVFSPQYLTWALPLVLAVSGKRGETLRWLLFAIMTVTQIYLRGYYGEVIHGTAIGVGTLLVRLLLLVVFAVVAVRGLERGAPGMRGAPRR
jgi:Glycosyltransferase family 87